MTSQTFRFEHKTKQAPEGYYALGRNGLVQAHGVHLSARAGVVTLANLTSRNEIANQSVVMPPEIMDALVAWWIENRKKE